MKIIADSGSTKTDWRVIDPSGVISQHSTQGFNPFFQNTEFIQRELEEKLLPGITANTFEGAEVYFYGAGCSSPERCNVVKQALDNVFKGSIVYVEHDLLGAARAACGHERGIAAILGTGSNTCMFDGNDIVDHVANLGFIMGDEGSGARIGMEFIRCFLYRELPKELESNFQSRYSTTKEEVLDAVYKKPLPSRYLASFSKFVFQNIKHPFMHNLVVKCFDEFFERHVMKYEGYQDVKFNCVGSVGFYYSDILRKVAERKGIQIGTILETPIAGLTLYHSEKALTQ